MEVIIKIPVKVHLRKFAHWYEGMPLDEPLVIRPGSLIGQILTQVICGKRKYLAYTWRSAPPSSGGHLDFLQIRLPKSIVDRGEYFLTKDGQDFFAQALSAMHRDMMLMHILSAKTLGQTERQSILIWMDLLNIEEDKDLTFDALKKMSNRTRPKIMGGVVFRRGQRPSPVR